MVDFGRKKIVLVYTEKKLLLALTSWQLNLYKSFPLPNRNIKTKESYNFTVITKVHVLITIFIL